MPAGRCGGRGLGGADCLVDAEPGDVVADLDFSVYWSDADGEDVVGYAQEGSGDAAVAFGVQGDVGDGFAVTEEVGGQGPDGDAESALP